MSTFAEDAGIRLADEPAPLFQLLVLCMLQAKPIRATVAVDAATACLADSGVERTDVGLVREVAGNRRTAA